MANVMNLYETTFCVGEKKKAAFCSEISHWFVTCRCDFYI